MLKQAFIRTSFRRVIPTVILYLAIAILIYMGEKLVPTGMCTPGLGVMILIFLPILSTFLLIISLDKDIDAKRLTAPTVIHLVVTGFALSLYYW